MGKPPVPVLTRLGVAVAALAAVVSATVVIVPTASADATFAPDGQAANQALESAVGDRPEPALQGEVPVADQLDGTALDGYICGLDVIAHHDLGGQGYNANLAWVGDCAFVATAGNGVHVVDVSDPLAPRLVTSVSGQSADGTGFTLETLAAFDGGSTKRSLLTVGRYGPYGFAPTDTPMDVYDVSACQDGASVGAADVVFVTTYVWEENIHNLTFTPDGERLWSTLPLVSIDLAPLVDLSTDRNSVPTEIRWDEPTEFITFEGNLEHYFQAIEEAETNEAYARGDFEAAQEHQDKRMWDEFLSHEAATSDDPHGNTLYLGGQMDTFETFTVIDVSNWPASAELLSQQRNGRGHSVRLFEVGGQDYVLHSEESIVDPAAKGCFSEDGNPWSGAAQPWITPLGDDRNGDGVGDIPDLTATAQFTLEINHFDNCDTQVAARQNSSVHYHDLDQRNDTTFAMFSMWNSGLRIVDVRDPLQPTEVAYFNAAAVERLGGDSVLDVAWGHVRYLPEQGVIWLATAHGGFWVLELQDHVRAALGLPELVSRVDDGTGMPDARPFLRSLGSLGGPTAYCTLNATTTVAVPSVDVLATVIG